MGKQSSMDEIRRGRYANSNADNQGQASGKPAANDTSRKPCNVRPVSSRGKNTAVAMAMAMMIVVAAAVQIIAVPAHDGSRWTRVSIGPDAPADVVGFGEWDAVTASTAAVRARIMAVA
jgi:hypothetical protein